LVSNRKEEESVLSVLLSFSPIVTKGEETKKEISK